jgi:hypothetical protein
MSNDRIAPLALVLVLLTAGAAHADYVSGGPSAAVTDFLAGLNPGQSFSFNNTTPAAMLQPTTLTAQASTPNGGFALSKVTGSAGVLKVFSQAGYPLTNEGSYATANNQLNVLEHLTVTSGSLPIGTPVLLSFSMAITGTHSVPGFQVGGSYQAVATATMTANDNGVGGGAFFVSYNSNNQPASTTLFAQLSTKVGNQITLQYAMGALAYVGGSATVAREALVDYAHTGLFGVQSNNPLVTVTSQSGFNYSSTFAAPEPGTASILLLGGTVVVIGRRRSRGRHK